MTLDYITTLTASGESETPECRATTRASNFTITREMSPNVTLLGKILVQTGAR